MRGGATAKRSALLDPTTLAEIRDLRLIARVLVEGFLAGAHASARPSAGLEFRQFRGYEPGDDLRRVDWKVYARSGRLVIREAQSERDLTVRFVLDATASTAAPAGAAGSDDLRVFDVERFLVAALACLVDLQGDRLRLDVVRDGRVSPVTSGRGGRDEFSAVIHALEGLEPAGRWPTAPAGALFASGSRRERELLVFVSDLHEAGSEILESLRALRVQSRELLLFQMVSRLEITFPFTGDVVFEDLETGVRVGGNASRMRAAAVAGLERRRGAVREEALRRGMAHELLIADEPLDRALRDFFRRRQRLG